MDLLRRKIWIGCRHFQYRFVTGTGSPKLTVTPLYSLVDVQVNIEVTGLEDSQQITLSAVLKDGKATFLSCGHYKARKGVFSCVHHPSEGGTFSGKHAMGLFTSMVNTRTYRYDRHVHTADVTRPFDVRVFSWKGYKRLEDVDTQVGNADLDSITITRSYMKKDVTRIEICHGNIRGALFVPEGDGPFPTVLDIPGAGRSLLENRAALLASRGFLAFSVYYMSKDQPRYHDLTLEYFLEVTDWLCKHHLAKPGGIGVVGLSMGGSLAYALAAYTSKIRTAVIYNALPILCMKDQYIDGKWWKGYIPILKAGSGKYSMQPYAQVGSSVEILPFWKHGAKVLALHGNDDVCVDPEGTLLKALYGKIPNSERKHFEYVYYAGAGHAVGPPYTNHRCEEYMQFSLADSEATGGTIVRFGGSHDANTSMSVDAWTRTLKHLKTYL